MDGYDSLWEEIPTNPTREVAIAELVALARRLAMEFHGAGRYVMAEQLAKAASRVDGKPVGPAAASG